MKVHVTRRAFLRAWLVGMDSRKQLAADLGLSPSYLSQLIGPHPSRNVGERLARRIEKRLSLVAYTLDFL